MNADATALYAEHAHLARAAARPRPGEDAEEVAAEAALGLWKAALDYDPSRVRGGASHFGAFAVQRVRWWLGQWRDRRRRAGPPPVPLSQVGDAADDALNPADHRRSAGPSPASREAVTLLRRGCPPLEFAVLWRRFALGQPPAQIALDLGVSRQAVGQRLARALRRARRLKARRAFEGVA